MSSEPILVTAPAVEPITLTQAKLHLRVTHDSEDDLITGLIVAARAQAEHLLGRRLITQTWDMVVDAFPGACQSLRLHPGLVKAQAVVYIQYLDTAGEVQTMPAEDYALDPHTLPGWIFPAEDADWPTDVADTANAVRVRVVCGFGDAAADVPQEVRQYMLMQLGTLYKFREEIVAGVQAVELPNKYAERLLDRWRVWGA